MVVVPTGPAIVTSSDFTVLRKGNYASKADSNEMPRRLEGVAPKARHSLLAGSFTPSSNQFACSYEVHD